MAILLPFSADQLRLLADADNHYRQYLQCRQAEEAHSGWMRWKLQNGKEYLVSGQSGGIGQQSHGPRSPSTEALYEAFRQGKLEAQFNLQAINATLNERAAQMKALRMGRIPHPFARLLRHYDLHAILGDFLLVEGTHALFAYEALAGYWFESALSATDDLDLLWHNPEDNNAEEKAELLAHKPASLLKYLKDIDRTFTVNQENRFQVRNNKGLVIDFLASEQSKTTRPNEYLSPIPLPGQEWLTLLPAVSTVVIDTQGLPVRLCCPDPRLYALHKAWLSRKTDRSPLKSHKDRQQALAVATLASRHLPQFPFDAALRKILPAELQNAWSMLSEQGALATPLEPGPLM